MAILQAILPYNPPSKTSFLSTNTKTIRKNPTLINLSQNPSNYSHLHNNNLKHSNKKPNSSSSLSSTKSQAIAADNVTVEPSSAEEKEKKNEEDDNVFVGPSSQAEVRGEREVVDYDWTEEWYPLYLTKNIPNDAPLGLTVFHKQLVLYRDASGQLRCYEDRCPHR